MAEIVGFDWDAGNVSHILRHSVAPAEVEQAVMNCHITFPAMPVNGELCWKLFGKAESSRYLVVVFTVRDGLFRTITAYPMNPSDRRKYATEIG